VIRGNRRSIKDASLTAASFSAKICLSPFFFLTGALTPSATAFFFSSSPEDASQSSSASSSSSPSNLLFLDTMGGASVGTALAGLAVVVVVAGASLSETSIGDKNKGSGLFDRGVTYHHTSNVPQSSSIL
jgi:hypothetical protein